LVQDCIAFHKPIGFKEDAGFMVGEVWRLNIALRYVPGIDGGEIQMAVPSEKEMMK